MRIYIIGNDAITLCREPPATVNKGEIAAASGEELHTARLSGKRLLALWNALPGVEKRRKVGDRDALIDQLWSAIEALPGPYPQSDAKRPSKQEEVIAMLQRSSSVSSPRSTSSKISKKSEAFPEQSTRLPSRVGSSYQRRSSGACCPVSRLDALGSSVYKHTAVRLSDGGLSLVA